MAERWQREVMNTPVEDPVGYNNLGCIGWVDVEWHRDTVTGFGHQQGNCRDDCPFGHGWSDHLVQYSNRHIQSVGYVEKDDDEGMILLTGRDNSESAIDQYDCSKFIPRSAIRKVTELSRKRQRDTR